MNAKLDITTRQYDENGRIDNIKVTSESEMYNKNGDVYVVYKEEEDGNKVTTTIKISDDEVSIKKFGSTNSNMIFKKGKTTETKYRTSHGLFIIEINTKELNIDKNQVNCIKLNIDYDIKIMDLFKGRNKIDILVETKE